MPSNQPLTSVNVMTPEPAEEVVDPSNIVHLVVPVGPVMRRRPAVDRTEAFEARLDELKALLNDPVALLTRTKDLLEGTARPVLSMNPLISLRFAAFALVVALHGVDLGGLDDVIRSGAIGFLDLTRPLALIHYRDLDPSLYA